MSHADRGFTLIELMLVVSILGILSTVAFPQYQRAVLRARSAEAATIMDGLARAVNDTISQQQTIPGGSWAGGANPPGTPGTMKRRFDWTMAGWTQLPMVVQGDAYYSYSFAALDPGQDGKNVSLSVTSVGDLDSDGVVVTHTITYAGVGYVFAKTGDVTVNPDAF